MSETKLAEVAPTDLPGQEPEEIVEPETEGFYVPGKEKMPSIWTQLDEETQAIVIPGRGTVLCYGYESLVFVPGTKLDENNKLVAAR